jgi:preprotein translocase subunit SecE
MAEKEKKIGKLKEAWRGFRAETKKVVWPTWKQVLKSTGVVVVIVLAFAVMIGILDYAFATGIAALSKLFG